MLLLLIRHAQAAEPDAARYPDDSLRPLVPKGRKIQRRMVRELRKHHFIPERVFASPWKRAWQTARVVLDELDLPGKARVLCPALAAPPDLDDLGDAIGDATPDAVIALVGHEPWMSELAAMLTTGKRRGLAVDFAKSGIMGIETERVAAGTGVLQFYLIPEG